VHNPRFRQSRLILESSHLPSCLVAVDLGHPDVDQGGVEEASATGTKARGKEERGAEECRQGVRRGLLRDVRETGASIEAGEAWLRGSALVMRV
jgi:hypothetical protein